MLGEDYANPEVATQPAYPRSRRGRTSVRHQLQLLLWNALRELHRLSSLLGHLVLLFDKNSLFERGDASSLGRRFRGSRDELRTQDTGKVLASVGGATISR